MIPRNTIPNVWCLRLPSDGSASPTSPAATSPGSPGHLTQSVVLDTVSPLPPVPMSRRNKRQPARRWTNVRILRDGCGLRTGRTSKKVPVILDELERDWGIVVEADGDYI